MSKAAVTVLLTYLLEYFQGSWQNGNPVGIQEWHNNAKVKYQILGALKLKEIDFQRKEFASTKLCLSHNMKTQQFANKSDCSALLFHGLASLMFTHISCDSSIFKFIYCMIPNTYWHTLGDIKPQPAQDSCNPQSVRKHQQCFLFKWQTQSTKEQCASEEQIQLLIHLFKAISVNQFLPIIIDHNAMLHVARYLTSLYFERKNSQKDGFCIQRSNPKTVSQNENTFLCDNNMVISALFLCDNISDCPGPVASDEIFCQCNLKSNISNHCKHLYTIGKTGKCPALFFQAHDNRCQVYYFAADNWATFSVENVNNKDDKQSQGDRMVQNFWTGINHTSGSQNVTDRQQQKKGNEYQIRCREEDFSHYDVFEICSYTLDSSGYLLPCKMGEHLQQCEEFECNLDFKCPHYYCVPWRYICDGKWDCPFGTDESEVFNCGVNRSCPMLFSCRNSQLCVHKMSICNHVKECPFGDDEEMCSLHDITCPHWCICLTFAAECTQLVFMPNGDELASLSVFTVLYLENVTLSLSSLDYFSPKLIILSIQNSPVQNLCKSLQQNSKVKLLNIQFNKNFELSSDCFGGLVSVLVINLNDNNLTWISQLSLNRIETLRIVNISNNPLCSVHQSSFVTMPQLKVLAILNIKFKGENILTNLEKMNLQFLETDEYIFCCQKQGTSQCSIQIPWFVSCANLLLNQGITVTCYIMSSTILVNLWSIIMHIISYGKDSEKAKANNILVLGLNVIDSFCSPLLLFCGQMILFTKETTSYMRSFGSQVLYATSFLDYFSSTTLHLLSC